MEAPSNKQLELARTMAKERNLTLPVEVETSVKKCRQWIDEHYNHHKPSDRQIDIAKRLAEQLGKTINPRNLESSQKLGYWIQVHLKEHKELVLKSKSERPLTDGQLSVINRYASAEIIKSVEDGDFKVGRDFLAEYLAKKTNQAGE